jgi:hypothetical protein
MRHMSRPAKRAYKVTDDETRGTGHGDRAGEVFGRGNEPEGLLDRYRGVR